jgi:peptide/nickel transport system ATP-binding protein
VDHLSKHYVAKKNWYGKPIQFTRAVDDVSFTVRKGETLGLVGESGCGKSTLGRTILRLIEATSGSITFNDESLLDLSSSEMRKIRKQLQIVFQDPYSSLNPRMTIGAAIKEPMDLHQLHGSRQQRKENVINLLEKVGLEADHYNRYPFEFSGGQRQRICIARTLAVEPSFIICDESVSALDVSVQAQVLNLLNDLKEDFGLTYIFISHDLSVVKHIADTIMVMQSGKIVERGDAESVFNDPQQAYTKKLIQSIPGF